MTHHPTFVFVHGTHASAHHWTWIAQELALRGHRALAVDLPGHGLDAHIPAAYHTQDLEALATEPTPTAEITVEDYVAHVEDVVRRAAANGPVLLAGHSQGGVTLSLVANRVPDLLSRLVYVAAFCCVDLPSMSDYQSGSRTPEHQHFMDSGVLVGDPAKLGVARVNWLSPDPGHQAAIKALNAHTHTDAESRAAHRLVQPDEPASIPRADARGHADTWGRVPRTYVRLSQDRFLPVELQDRWIAEADKLTPDNPFDVHTVDSPHYLPRDPRLVAILDDLARAAH